MITNVFLSKYCFVNQSFVTKNILNENLILHWNFNHRVVIKTVIFLFFKRELITLLLLSFLHSLNVSSHPILLI